MGIFDVVGALSGAVGTVASIYGVQEQNRANERAATLAYQRQRDLINDANIYNSPKSQMVRLREAGLNPHLVYGNGAGGMVSASAGTPPAARHENTMANIGIYATMSQIAAQKRQLSLEERKLSLDERRLSMEENLQPSVIAKNMSEADKNNSSIDVNTHTIFGMMQDREYKSQLHDLNKSALEIQNNISDFSYRERQLLFPLLYMNSLLQNEKITNDINMSKIQIGIQRMLAGATIEKINSEINLNKEEYSFLEVTREYRTMLEREKSRLPELLNRNKTVRDLISSTELVLKTLGSFLPRVSF